MAPSFAVSILALPVLVMSSKLLANEAVQKERPVMKVVRLLEDMSVELNKDLQDDKEVHEKLSCWCETNNKEKSQAIEVGEATISQLESSLGEALATIKKLTEKRKATLDQVNNDHASLNEASGLRVKENKAFQSEETDLIEAIKACKQAIIVLGQHHPELAQLRAVARTLRESRIVQFLRTSTRVHGYNLDMLNNFVDEVQGSSSFMAIPGFQSYAPQSSQILGILQQMQEDFESRLEGSQKSEQKAREDFESLRAAKEEEIAAGRKTVRQLDSDKAELSEKHAQQMKEFEDTTEQLALDKEFLANLKAKCSESAAEFDARVKDRLDEIAAVEDTIRILNSDEAFDVFDKAVNSGFLQTSALSQDEVSRRNRALVVMTRAADRVKDPKLVMLAASSKLDSFKKVIEEVDKLISELKNQQTDEIAHRDWCIKELAVNDRATSKASDEKSSLETKKADLGKTIESLKSSVAAAKSAIEESQSQMKRVSEAREAENADFQQTIADQRLTQMILKKAVDRMKQVYALVQQPGAPHIATSGTHTDPGNGPARFTSYGKNAGGARVVALLESVMADSSKTENDAIAAEYDSQTAYESFMKESNESIRKHSESISNLSEALSKAKVSMTMTNEDLKGTQEKLGDLSEMLGDVHKSCDFTINNFDARQEARSAEMDALKEAKAILSGMH
jgi:DNA repair exonuclease SbcCD ATPase subunit